MKDIIDLLLEDPDGFIDETKTKGVLKVYRNNDFHNEIEELFDREPYYRRDIPQPKKFQKDYLGLTANGPTNQVMVTLKLKGDEQNADTLEKRLAYIGNNIVFVDAFPVKNPPPPSKAKASRPLTENKSLINEVKPDNSNSEDLKTGESKPTDSQSDKTTPEESKVTDTKAENLKEDKLPVDSKQDKPMTEDSKTTDAKSKNIQSEKSQSEDSNAEKGKPESKESKSDKTKRTEPTK
ncbi:MAG: hypothetical protein FJX03_05470 [Alphaproteobacteria bacterium]|nr:hypothetical protein [Alphaproteobacteria bacterium]